MVAVSSSGVHFKEPWLMPGFRGGATTIYVYDSASAAQTGATTNFFTEMARRGLQDTTNWTADTYKTLLSVSSGKGLVAGIMGPTAGGASTTTFEITVDGVLTEIAVTSVASGERASLLAAGTGQPAFFTTVNIWATGAELALDTGKNQFSAYIGTSVVPSWETFILFGTPCLRFNRSLLIRAKHSASITNSTATAYSAVMYRLGL